MACKPSSPNGTVWLSTDMIIALDLNRVAFNDRFLVTGKLLWCVHLTAPHCLRRAINHYMSIVKRTKVGHLSFDETNLKKT